MSSEYKMTVGLEIHAELKTKSKMFCGCANSSLHIGSDAEAFPNTHICPVCMGYPGTLPVVNKEAVRKVLMVGTAAGSELADFTEFDRKNYFYPDIPKGYQISQYKYPLVTGGEIAGVKLTRIHLEEDTARSSHEVSGVSLVDFNRAGVPLMELVTEPVIHSSEEAVTFAKELQLLLRTLDVSTADMEKGEMRVEVNISISDSDTFGTKVEVKNINSFKAAGKAIDFEFKRQVELLKKGEKIIQETRGWDENKEVTFSQRKKESAHDYRYFPEPDITKFIISEIPELSKESLQNLIGELPWEKRNRFIHELGIKASDVELYVSNKEAMEFFEEVISNLPSSQKEVIQTASNYITSDLVGLSKTLGLNFTLGKITTINFADLIKLVSDGQLSSRGAKDTLKIMFEEGGEPLKIAEEKGLIQKNNEEEIQKLAEEILRENPDVVVNYKNGKESLLQFFIGQGMKKTSGSVNPEILKKIILELLKR